MLEEFVFLAKDGRYKEGVGDCLLFPSKECRDWSKFTAPKVEKFDIRKLNAFDRVLVREAEGFYWRCEIFSHIEVNDNKYLYMCIGSVYACCIPYNDDTKHLVGTCKNPPEFYDKCWEID